MYSLQHTLRYIDLKEHCNRMRLIVTSPACHHRQKTQDWRSKNTKQTSTLNPNLLDQIYFITGYAN